MEEQLEKRLEKLNQPAELRRFDVFNDIVGEVAAREARSADTFVALRPDGMPDEPAHVVEGVLFGSGRHLLLVPDDPSHKALFDNIIVAWKGSRESARALAEALPYLQRAREVTVVVIIEEKDVEYEAVLGADAVRHLKHHGIDAALRHIPVQEEGVAETLLAEAKRCQADLLVLGGYGHSRLREWLLGGVTYKLMHQTVVPILIAH
jgi:nucleotide-binding universal stress UspA family protein